MYMYAHVHCMYVHVCTVCMYICMYVCMYIYVLGMGDYENMSQ